MNEAERRRRALAAFREVVDLPVDQRAAWLEQHCAHDAQLIAQVLALLAADDREGEPFDGDARIWGQALHVSEEHEAHDAMLGRQLGAWRVLDVLGRGGMGAVYRVERDDGAYTQQAALKLIRASTDSQAARERFLRERQILAALRHPHIATLLDGGISPQGEPYFVMELIDGQPIDRWCDAHNLGLRERVTLFLQVLDAVRYAHRNLVVHRDLKPSNLMVDAEGRVKLLDFGIAKQLEGGAVTATHDRALTFEYASPEQLHDAPITTATDVWQLGVVLHRLLSGSHPFGLTRDTPLASQLQHLERDPEPLTRAAAKLPPEQAQQRGGHTPASLSRALRGSLSAIVQTCLRRDPEARYATADALANDLQAWLDSRPIAAVPLRRMQRLRLWGRRNRTLAAAGVAVALALVAGTGVALWQAHEARAQARIATRESASARASLAFLTDTLAAAAPEEAMRRDVSVRDLLDQARKKLDEKSLDPQVRQFVQLMLATLYHSLGDVRTALPLFEAGFKGVQPQSREDVAALFVPMSAYIGALGQSGRGAEGLAEAKRAEVWRLTYAPQDEPLQLAALVFQGNGHFYAHDEDQAEAFWKQAIELAARLPDPAVNDTIEAYQLLSGVLAAKGEYEPAVRYAQAGLDFADRRQVSPNSPVRVSLLLSKANALQQAGELAEAEAVIRQGMALQRATIGEGGTRMSDLYNSLGIVLNDQGRYREAVEALEHSDGLEESASGSQVELAIGLGNLGSVYENAGDYARAIELFDRAVSLADRSGLSPDDATRRRLARSRARSLAFAGRYAEADLQLRDLQARALRLEGDASIEYAMLIWQRTGLARRMGDWAAGTALLAQARTRLSALLPPTHPLFAHMLRAQAAFARQRGALADAERAQRQALVRLQGDAALAIDTAIAQAELADILQQRGDAQQAAQLLAQALPVLRKQLLPQEVSLAAAESLAARLALNQHG